MVSRIMFRVMSKRQKMTIVEACARAHLKLIEDLLNYYFRYQLGPPELSEDRSERLRTYTISISFVGCEYV
jgi:DNA-binding transcriptional MocR family regulator